MPGVIKESGGGFVYDTEEELMMAMDRVLEEPSIRSSVGQQGFEALKKKWTAEVHIKRYLELIKSLEGTPKILLDSPMVTEA